MTESDYLPFNVCEVDERSILDLNIEQATFLWNNLLIETLLRIPNTPSEKQEMLDKCREQYNDQKMLDDIHEFDRSYEPNQAIKWYTRSTFVYKRLNAAFRTLDIDDIFIFKFFFTDLYKQLEKAHEKFVSDGQKVLTVYRGQHLSLPELKKLQNNIHKLISMNTFLSTTQDYSVATIFAETNLNDNPSNLQSVIFKLTVDSSVVKKPFANIKNESYMSDEDEVLFAMGTVFRIQSIKLVELEFGTKTTAWLVELIGEQEIHIQELYDHFKREMLENSKKITLHHFGHFLWKKGEYNKAMTYFYRLKQQLDGHPDYLVELGMLCNQIGIIYLEKQEFLNALENFDQALNIYKQAIPSVSNYYQHQENISRAYSNKGRVYCDLNKNEDALREYQQALNISKQPEPSYDLTLAMIYNNIAGIYHKQNKYELALETNKKALLIRSRTLPSYHSDLAMSFNNIGAIYDNLGDSEKALNYYQKALEIQLYILGPDHDNVAVTYNNMGVIEVYRNNFDDSLKYFEKALNIDKKVFGLNHPNIALSYINISKIYRKKKLYKIALDYLAEAMEIYKKFYPSNNECFATVYDCIGRIFAARGEYKQALEWYQKAGTILEDNGKVRASSIRNLGRIHEHTHDYENAFIYYRKALLMSKQSFPPNHPAILYWENRIQRIKEKL